MKWEILCIAAVIMVSWAEVSSASDKESVVDKQKTIVDFADTDRDRWFPINDDVMGGVSQGNIRRTDRGTGVFAGLLSLENNGGFASVRVGFEGHDLSEYAGLEIRVRGDGRKYQLRLRTNTGMDGVAYRAEFATRDGEWTTIQIRFDEFVPTYRGRILTDVEPLDRTDIRQLAFMIADKRPGPFSLEIDFVRTWDSGTQ